MSIRPEVYYLWICMTLICQRISLKVKVTSQSDPQHFAVMTLVQNIFKIEEAIVEISNIVQNA